MNKDYLIDILNKDIKKLKGEDKDTLIFIRDVIEQENYIHYLKIIKVLTHTKLEWMEKAQFGDELTYQELLKGISLLEYLEKQYVEYLREVVYG